MMEQTEKGEEEGIPFILLEVDESRNMCERRPREIVN
jgi:hypothetical protein